MRKYNACREWGWVLTFPRMSLWGRSPGDASVSARQPRARPCCLSLQLPWQERSTRHAQMDVSLWIFLVKSIKAKSANSPANVNIASAMQLHWICSMSSARGSLVCFFFTRGNIRYLNSFSVVTALSDPDFADSSRGSSRKSSRRKINAHLLPSQQRNFFENFVSWTRAFRECLEIINI